MPKFLTIGYGDQEGYDRTPDGVRAAAHELDAKLIEDGAIVGIASAPVQVRNPDAVSVETRAGQFMKSDLPVAGFAIIEADSIEDAIEKVAGVPCAVAHGVVEVWQMG
ncbi:MAG: transcription initiation protein [Pseudomonadota bacterium]